MFDSLSLDDALALKRDGSLMLRGAVPTAWLELLRASFEANYLPSDGWPVPRGNDWRHAMLDLDPLVQQVCRLPILLAATGQILNAPFFLSQVEGRAPCQNNQTQILHRDVEISVADHVVALVYLDPFDAGNGATRFVPQSHQHCDHDDAVPIIAAGQAGDILIMDARVLHGATTNSSGGQRRSLLIAYANRHLYDDHLATASLRGVRMATDEIFGENQGEPQCHS
ncbi:MAG: putative dioxygenase, PhyH family [Pseudomonadota bacterium]